MTPESATTWPSERARATRTPVSFGDKLTAVYEAWCVLGGAGRDNGRARTALAAHLLSTTSQPVEQIARDTERDNFLTAEQAREYGIIDKVLQKRAVDG